MSLSAFWFLLLFIGIAKNIRAERAFMEIVTRFAKDVTKVRDVIIFGCQKPDLWESTKALLQRNFFVYPINLSNTSSSNSLIEILTRHSHARTSVVVDCKCNGSTQLLETASEMLYFNKTYQWLLFDGSNIGVEILLPSKLKYPGLNSQVTYVNQSNELYNFWDIHSKGRHLGSSLEFNMIATFNNSVGFTILKDISAVQGIKFRGQFNGLRLRGATVIDQDNITTNEKIETVLARLSKDAGVAAFVKYHYDLTNLLKHRLNFTVIYRNSRGWAGRLGNTTFRLGFLGVVQRNEADIGASGAFNRINRFAEFDIIHQSWKFETGFLYRFTPDLSKQGGCGNFLAPFDKMVWIFATVSICALNFVWRLIERINELCLTKKPMQNQKTQDEEQKEWQNNNEMSWSGLSLNTVASICQQSMDPVPAGLPSRTIVLTLFLFSLVIYNYYTSSVVGGLLSGTAQGPTNADQILKSPLIVSFEDIGYYKILFRERQNKSLTVQQMYDLKVLPDRKPIDIPVYLRVEDAIPYLKQGGYAFHCELLDAYSEIERRFDAAEICDTRVTTGLLDDEIVNWDITKQSQYSEIFRIVMCRSTEVGLVSRLMKLRRTKKPHCQGLFRVFPMVFSGVSSAYILLAAGFFCGSLTMLVERIVYKMKNKKK